MVTTKTEMLRRAAVVVASLDQREADALLDRLPATEAAVVRRLLVELGDPEPAEQQAALVDFFLANGRGATPPAGAARQKPTVAENAPSANRRPLDESGATAWRPAAGIDRFARALAGDEVEDAPPFRFLHEAPGERLTPFLAGEHPQTVAVVLSHLPPDQAAGVLSALPPATQAVVLRRLADLDEADPDIVRDVERGLAARLSEHVRMERRRAAGLQAVASILKASKPDLRRQMLANLARHDRRLARKLDPPKVEFDDLEFWDDPALRGLWRAAGSELATLALAGASAAMVARWRQAMPDPQSEALRQSLASFGPMRLSDVEEAQRQLAATAAELVLDWNYQPAAAPAGAPE